MSNMELPQPITRTQGDNLNETLFVDDFAKQLKIVEKSIRQTLGTTKEREDSYKNEANNLKNKPTYIKLTNRSRKYRYDEDNDYKGCDINDTDDKLKTISTSEKKITRALEANLESSNSQFDGEPLPEQPKGTYHRSSSYATTDETIDTSFARGRRDDSGDNPLIPPLLLPGLCRDEDEARKRMMSAWYMAGYHTGYLEAMRKFKK